MARISPLNANIGACLLLLCLSAAAWAAKKSPKTVTTVNGGPIRKVYIHSASPDMTSSAATQLAQDTCLTPVSDAKQADAVLEVGIALPDLGGASSSGGFGASPRPRKMNGNNNGNPKAQREISATCSDGSGSGGCKSSYTPPRGGLAQPPADWPGNVGGSLDVSLAVPGDASQELWEQDDRSKQSWSDQLRRAAGCPVCPGERFNPRKYSTYRQWIEAECPSVLTQ